MSTSSPTFPVSSAPSSSPSAVQKRAGDISDAFASLSGGTFTPLAPRYAGVKRELIQGYEHAVRDSWERLLGILKRDIPRVVQLGQGRRIPEIGVAEVLAWGGGDGDEAVVEKVLEFGKGLRETGVGVVRGVVEEETVLRWKEGVREYVGRNPGTRAFPASNPQIFELYWTAPQLLARSHPSLLLTQKFLMAHWHSHTTSPISTSHPVLYADRLRMRLPGDTSFALGPHVDGGSVERWDPRGYGGATGTYQHIFSGNWEKYDPWDAHRRLGVEPDLHKGVGACSAFRMFQGWLAMSEVGKGEGTLLVNPLLREATAYFLLRPFFTPRSGTGEDGQSAASEDIAMSDEFLDPRNWEFTGGNNSWLHGATPGHGQELNALLHPHLRLKETMTHVPDVRPGDYVVWHCDTIHAVDPVHRGKSDSSVLYIPACPLTVKNVKNLVRQREAFIKGTPSPDFGGGKGESEDVGRVGVDEVGELVGMEGLRGMGLEEWDESEVGLTKGERELLGRANGVLGF